MGRVDVSTRDRGLGLVSRINRWLIAGAVGLSGVISVAAANAFHGHHRAQSSHSSAVSGVQQQQSSGGGGGDSTGSGSLQQPAQAPAPAPTPAGGGVVSGGS